MGYDKSILQSEHIARCLDPATRKAARVTTAAEAQDRHAAREERELQQQIAQYLRLRGVWFDQDAMHKRRTGTRATPDFLLCYLGWAIGIEAKSATGRVNEAQRDCHRAMVRDGWYVLIARSLADVQGLLRAIDAQTHPSQAPAASVRLAGRERKAVAG